MNKNALNHQLSAAQDRFGRQVAACLSENATTLPHDISERLRVARMQALQCRQSARAVSSMHTMANGTAALGFGDGEGSPWQRLAALLPLLLLAVGLVVVARLNNDHLAKEIAEIDAAILTDDLPPAAYADPGFAQFLKLARNANP